MKTHHPIIAGVPAKAKQSIHSINPYTNKPFAIVGLADRSQLLSAITKATFSFQTTKKLSSAERSQVLLKIRDGIILSKTDLARTITQENGKPITDSLGEVERAITTFTIAAEEAKRIGGEYLPVDITSATKDKRAVVGRFPIGPIVGITPFNFPLNLVAHKIAPAIASGNPFILKPASKTPLTALKLGEIIAASGWPKDAISIVPCTAVDASTLITDERVKLVSFTGSADNGWAIKNQAGKKKVVLELGGNAAVIIEPDVNIARAAQRCVTGGFYYAGQNCIHVQRIYCHEKIWNGFVKAFVEQLKALRLGDPMNPQTQMSVMIDTANVARVNAWIEEAIKKKARILYRGKTPALAGWAAPTVLTNVPTICNISCKEAFGPIVIIEPYKDYRKAIAAVNDSAYGLQAGVFTNDVNKVWYAFSELAVGGVLINEIPTFRVDHMPYGGIKHSGFGREGLKYAIEEMTELKILILHIAEPP